MSFSELPSVSKRKITSFLDYRSALKLSNISRAFHSDIPLSLLSPRYELVYSQIVHGESSIGDIPIKSARIPIFGNDPHTVLLKCRWKDQGWGDRKGKLYIVAHSDESVSTDSIGDKMAPFDSGRVIYESPIASHTFENLTIAFSPQINTQYHLFYVVGGGGGHLLIVEDLYIETMVFDDERRSMKSAYSSLHENGIIRGEDDNNLDLVLYTKLLVEILKLCTSQQIDCFNALFRKYNIGTNDPRYLSSLSCVCLFFLQLLENCNQEEVFNAEEGNNLITLPPFTLFQYASLEGMPGNAMPIKCSPVPFMKRRTKSLRLTCNWEDDGNCVSKGKLYLVAERESAGDSSNIHDSQATFLSGKRLVWESPIVTHEKASLEMSFSPDDHEHYFLYYDFGGASEEEYEDVLHVSNLCIHLTVFDDDIGSLELCYNKLMHQGALDSRHGENSLFPMELLLASISFLRENDSSSFTSGLHDFFLSNNFNTDTQSLCSLRELTQSIKSFKEHETTKASRTGEAELRMFSCM